MLPTGHVEFTWAALNLLQRKAGLFREADYRLVALAALAPDLLDKPLALTVYRDTDAALFWGHNLWLHLAVWLAAWGWSRWSNTKRSTPSTSSGQALSGLVMAFPPPYHIGNAEAEHPECSGAESKGRSGQRTRPHPSTSAGAPMPASAQDARLFSGQGSLPYLLAFSGHLIADRMWGFQESLFYPLGAGYWHPWTHVGAPVAMLDAYLTIIRTTPILVAFEVIGLVLLGWFVWDRKLWRRDRLAAWLRTGRFAAAGQVLKFRNRGFSRSSDRGNNRLKPRIQKL